MDLDPKPITLSQVDEADYEGVTAPQPFVVVGDVPGGGGEAPVASVNGQTGAVVLSASDVSARPDSWTPAIADVANLQAQLTDLPTESQLWNRKSGVFID